MRVGRSDPVRKHTPRPGSSPAAMFRNGLERSGAYQNPGTGIYGGVLWRTQTGGAVRSSPTIVGSVVLIGSCDGNLYALDVSSGREKWKFVADSAVVSTAAAVGGAYSSPAIKAPSTPSASMRGSWSGRRKWAPMSFARMRPTPETTPPATTATSFCRPGRPRRHGHRRRGRWPDLCVQLKIRKPAMELSHRWPDPLISCDQPRCRLRRELRRQPVRD